MDIVTSAQTATQVAAAAQTTSGNALSGDFETFLKMLTTQAQNQDPFNPVDATEYASQLASFSTVEQQVLTNELLSELTRLATGGALERLAGWIGMEARAPGVAYFDGAPVELLMRGPEDGQTAVLSIRDAAGNLRNRIALDAGDEGYVWDGSDLTGEVVPEGLYNVELEIYRDETLEEKQEVASYLRVDEVARMGASNQITLRGGATVDAAAITALRRARE